MARPLEFDRTTVIRKAVDAFWQSGYDALSAGELADAMEVAKSSLYNTFGSKRTVLLEVLSHYADSQSKELFAAAKCPNAIGYLEKTLLEVVRGNNQGRGCLLVNMTVELSLLDDEMQRHLKAGFDSIASGFKALIKAGQATGQINCKFDAATHAMNIVSGIAGLRVMVKTGFPEAKLLPFVEVLLSGLKP